MDDQLLSKISPPSGRQFVFHKRDGPPTRFFFCPATQGVRPGSAAFAVSKSMPVNKISDKCPPFYVRFRRFNQHDDQTLRMALIGVFDRAKPSMTHVVANN